MIPFASQRSGGQDLATHLQNDLDNDYQEVAEIRGAIADDLHGAFAEWELQAKGLTKCKNYLYSMSINPWEKVNGPMTREQYTDYIDRAEERLGLSGQPRAVVFHIKDGREHAHVVWSRIDVANEKAVQMSFDHQSLMMVTREFARDHGLTLPDGYEKGRESRSRQNTLYEQYHQNNTGITKEERMEQVTKAWRESDSPQSFVTALSEAGYMLATGNRPYLIVDIYGYHSALPRMIDDKTVRAKDLQAFLGKDFPPEVLPSLEEARTHAKNTREKIKQHQSVEKQADRCDRLKAAHLERRKPVEQERNEIRATQDRERKDLGARQRAEREALKQAFGIQEKIIREKRDRFKPEGLAAFLGRITGVEFARKKLHEHQDKKRFEEFSQKEDALAYTHRDTSLEQQRFHEMQSLDMNRNIRNLDKVEKREMASLEAAFKKERNLSLRAGLEHTPSFGLDFAPPGRKAQTRRAANRFQHMGDRKTAEKKKEEARQDGPPDLTDAFDRAAGVEDDDGGDGGSGGDERGTRLRSEPHSPNRKRNRKRDRDQGRDR